jgi:REP element-mobilizing transposase RayT
MTYPRSLLVDPATAGVYHCVSRCVRRAWLCGEDALTQRNFDHRRQWVQDRLALLAECFAISVYSFAVMSNHVHVVVAVEPERCKHWSDEEVQLRWARVMRQRERDAPTPASVCDERIAALRARLSNLSWFMRCLNEPIARRANAEDKVTGHFWEGRFRCQLLLDERAVLAAMAYVDLNPVRAGMAQSLDASDHTSIQQRVGHSAEIQNQTIKPMFSGERASLLDVSESAYIELVAYSGQQYRPGKATLMAKPPLVQAMEDDGGDWLNALQAIRMSYRAIGSTPRLIELAVRLRQRWVKRERRVMVARRG